MSEQPTMTAQEFRVWCLRDAAATIRGDDSVEDAVAHLQDIADRLELLYIEEATNAAHPTSLDSRPTDLEGVPGE